MIDYERLRPMIYRPSSITRSGIGAGRDHRPRRVDLGPAQASVAHGEIVERQLLDQPVAEAEDQAGREVALAGRPTPGEDLLRRAVVLGGGLLCRRVQG